MPRPPHPPSPSTLRALRSLAFPYSSPVSLSANCARHPPPRRPRVRSLTSHRSFCTSLTRRNPVSPGQGNRYAPKTHDRGPASSEDTQTDFGKMDIFNSSNVAAPATSIDACTADGFHLNNGTKTTSGHGVLLIGGEAFTWSPHLPSPSPSTSSTSPPTLLDALGRLHLPLPSLAPLSLLHPKPDLLLLGTGSKLHMLSPTTRDHLNRELGIRVDVMDTANASSAYNLLAQERGVEGGSSVSAALLPLGWRGR